MPRPPESVKKTLIVLFGAWLTVVMILLTVTAVYEDKMYDLYGILGIFVYAGLFGLFWRYRSRLIERLPATRTTIGRFLLAGWLAAVVVELLLYFTFSYQRGINVLLDLAYTSPTYLGLLIAWWVYLNRYPISYREVFFVGGMNGLLFETPQKIISGQNLFSMIVGSPGHIFIYGSILLVPVALLGLATARPESPVLGKYAFGLVVIPLIALPGFILSVTILTLAGAS